MKLIARAGKSPEPHPALRFAVGQWNFEGVSPQQVMGRFNGFVKTVVLRVSEARDSGSLTALNFMTTRKVLLPHRRTCCAWTKNTCVNITSPIVAA
jgi:hypothetical protein